MDCSGYMAQTQFDRWLQDLDEDMRQQGCKIALILDGAPGHCGITQVGLTNVTVVQLPSKTTSVTQPLDAGVIRSFKVKYTQQMLEIISKARAETNNPEATVPNGVLWSCLVNAWERVTPKCIRNCFHNVPVMPTTHKVQLQSLGTESPDEELTRLQQELGEQHQGMKDVIFKQKNVALLNYISMCYAEGPSKSIFESAMKITKDERFRDVFKQCKENDFVEEDKIGEEDDLDMDYEFPRKPNKEKVAFILRSRAVTILQEYSSPESSPPKKSVNEAKNVFQNILDAAQELRCIDRSRMEHELGHFYKYAESFVDRLRLLKDE